ncbi:MAG: hypothetical protein NT094_00890 [Candidatus Staskawiczbacteria bacterium]|nr:hypothetical protein [Candidatus Staskawiczbacteria bacterium]
MKIRDFILKIQALPEKNKKIILVTIVVIFAVILGYFWIISAINNLDKIGKNVSQIKLPELQTPGVKTPSAQTQNNQITDWKTYTNTKYSFEIKYPSDWTFREYDSGVALSPKGKITEQGSINVGFYKRSSEYCKISFDDYVKIAGPSEIQNYESVNTINGGTNQNGIEAYEITWNYNDMQGHGKISLPITYFNTKPELCGDIEAFSNDNNYSDIYDNIISSLNFTKK